MDYFRQKSNTNSLGTRIQSGGKEINASAYFSDRRNVLDSECKACTDGPDTDCRKRVLAREMEAKLTDFNAKARLASSSMKKRTVSISAKKEVKAGKSDQKLANSMCVTIICQYLTDEEVTKMQGLSRFFYDTQIPRCTKEVQLKASNPTRLHLLNQNYIVRYDLLRWTKSKRLIKGDDRQELWNSQSIEVRGRIYVIGGTIANTRTYLK